MWGLAACEPAEHAVAQAAYLHSRTQTRALRRSSSRRDLDRLARASQDHIHVGNMQGMHPKLGLRLGLAALEAMGSLMDDNAPTSDHDHTTGRDTSYIFMHVAQDRDWRRANDCHSQQGLPKPGHHPIAVLTTHW